jgi:two-component system OmpR family response regulator
MKILCIDIGTDILCRLAARGMAAANRRLSSFAETADYLRADDSFDALLVRLYPEEEDGLDLRDLSLVREAAIALPIVILSDVPRHVPWTDFRAGALEQGADDLIRAPGSDREIAASLRRVGRFGPGEARLVAQGVKLLVDPENLRCSLDGRPLRLTRTECQLVGILARHAPGTVSRQALLDTLYVDGPRMPGLKIIEVFVSKIRTKMNRLGYDGRALIESVYGRGYRIALDAYEPYEEALMAAE